MKPVKPRRRRRRQPMQVVVSVVTPEVVGRLEADNAALQTELKKLRSEKDALHHTVYRLIDVVGDLKKRMS